MKKLLIVLAALALLPVCPAHADSIAVGDQVIVNYWSGANTYSNGGVFGVFNTEGEFLFPTFCVETSEYFTPGATYTVVRIDDDIVLGGLASGRDLPPQVAWLYSQYRGLTEAQQKAAGGDYQAAIWWYVTDHAQGLNNSLAVAAASHTDGIGDVRVLGFDLATAEGTRVQDFLMVPEPSSMLLLGTGLIGLAAAARRRNKK